MSIWRLGGRRFVTMTSFLLNYPISISMPQIFWTSLLFYNCFLSRLIQSSLLSSDSVSEVLIWTCHDSIQKTIWVSMQSNLIIKNTVKQILPFPVNYYVQVCKTQNQNTLLNMGLMFLEGRLNKIRHIDIFLCKKYFWLFPEITSTCSPNLACLLAIEEWTCVWSHWQRLLSKVSLRGTGMVASNSSCLHSCFLPLWK